MADVLRKGERDYRSGGECVGNAHICTEHGRARIRFRESRGFGASDYEVRIAPSDFTDMVEAMLRANPEEAVKAFAAALKDGIPAKKEVWHPITRAPAAAA